MLKPLRNRFNSFLEFPAPGQRLYMSVACHYLR